MDRLEFMKRLEGLLYDITPAERAEALQYYNDYLDDAGVENEQAVMASLGSPEKVAATIKEGLKENGENAEYTEQGYSNSKWADKERQEVVKKTKEPLSGKMIALIVVLCFCAFPLLISLVSKIFSAGFGLMAGVLSLVFGAAICAAALWIAAVVIGILGICIMFASPLAGILLIGAALLLAGMALFFTWLTVWVFGVAIPRVIRFLVTFFKKITRKKEGGIV